MSDNILTSLETNLKKSCITDCTPTVAVIWMYFTVYTSSHHSRW